MGLMDKVKQAMKGRSEAVERGIDAAASAADKRTKGKYREKLQQGATRLKAQSRKLDDERRDGEQDGRDDEVPPSR